MKPPNFNHPHYNEAAFRKYEKVIRSILETHPQPSVIDPDTVKSENYANRLRNAIKAYGLSPWESDISKYDLQKIFRLFERGGDWVVANSGAKVVIGPPAKVSVSSKIEPLDIIAEKRADEIDAQVPEIWVALLILINADVIHGPIRIINAPDLDMAKKFPNVEIIQKDDHILLM